MKTIHILDNDFWDEILDTLSRNKARSLLTSFGIFWGVFMLLLLMGGGNGLQSMLGQIFAGFASNSGFVVASETSMPYKGFKKGRIWSLENDDVTRIAQGVADVEIVTPVLGDWNSKAKYQAQSMDISVKGIYPDYSVIENPRIIDGRDINGVDVLQQRKVCVIGKQIADQLFTDSISPCGKFLQINNIYYHVVGVSGKDGTGMSIMGDASTTVLIPFSTMQHAYNRGKTVDLIAYTVKENAKISTVQPQVEQVLKRNHYLHPDDDQAVLKINAEAIFQMIDNTFKGINILVWMIGLGTLLSGAIGVSNIMMVTIKERTTEIGIRRAIGAKPKDILAQVFCESIVLTLIAGFSGICVSVGVLQGIEQSAQDTAPGSIFQMSFVTAISAALLLITLGIISGLAPAIRALSIKPVDAMRDE